MIRVLTTCPFRNVSRVGEVVDGTFFVFVFCVTLVYRSLIYSMILRSMKRRQDKWARLPKPLVFFLHPCPCRFSLLLRVTHVFGSPGDPPSHPSPALLSTPRSVVPRPLRPQPPLPSRPPPAPPICSSTAPYLVPPPPSCYSLILPAPLSPPPSLIPPPFSSVLFVFVSFFCLPSIFFLLYFEIILFTSQFISF